MRRHAKAVFVLAMLCSFFALAATASAAYLEVGSFAGGGEGPGGSGSADGQLANPGQVDVNDASGVLYVADTANNRVQAFNQAATGGTYDSQVAITAPTGVAVDHATGDVYVANATGVSKFTSSLSPAGGWSDPGTTGALAVDPSTGNLLVADQGASLVRRYASDGSALDSFSVARPLDLAASSSGEILVVSSTGNLITNCAATSSVERFSGAGSSLGRIGAGLVAPGAVAIDSSDGTIYVAAYTNRYNCGSELPQIAAFAPDGTASGSVELAGDTQYATVPGLAVRGDGSQRTYAVTKSPMGDSWGATKITALEDVPPPPDPVATIEPASNVDSFSVTLNGTANPEGGALNNCYFEYSTDNSFSEIAVCEESVGPGASPVPVHADVSGLAAAMTYNFRLVLTKGPAVARTSVRTFTTASASPAVRSPAVTEITANGATFRGQVNPRGLQTSYRFEYVSDPDFQGSGFANARKAPVPDAGVGAGNKLVAVSQPVSGLTAGATYRYRLVAVNAKGATSSEASSFAASPCSNDAVRIQQAAQLLPSCRAYEMVSPLDKNNGNVNPIAVRRSSADGEAFMFSAGNAFADSEGSFKENSYISRRSPKGWLTEGLNPYLTPNGNASNSSNQGYFNFTDDLGKGVLMAGHDPNDRSSDISKDKKSMYLWIRGGAPKFIRLTPPPAFQFVFQSPVYLGASTDMSRIFIQASEQLTPDAPPGGGTYEWHAGNLEFIGVLPGGETASGATLGRGSEGDDQVSPAISADGTQVVLTMGSPKQLYLRENGESKLISFSHVSGEEGTPAPSGATFMGSVKTDGRLSTVYFASPDLLFDEAKGDPGGSSNEVYAYDVRSEELTQLSVDRDHPELAGADAYSSWVGASKDGSHVYFWARSHLTPDGGEGLYLWHDGKLRFVKAWSNIKMPFPGNVQISNDGQRALIDNYSGGGVPVRSVYLYDAPSGHLECISCDGEGLAKQPGGFPAGGGEPGAGKGYSGVEAQRPLSYNLSADGSRAFFVSLDRLVAGDNNDAYDVYEWHEGRVDLLSSGRSSTDSYFLGASPSGRDVFIGTRAQLVPGDKDALVDVYDVRIGGGFLFEAPPTPCSADSCQAAPDAGRSWSAPSSTQLAGSNNANERRKARCVAPRKGKKNSAAKRAKASKAKPRCSKPRQGKNKKKASAKVKGGNR